MRVFAVLLSLVLLTAFAPAVHGQDKLTSDQIVIQDPWVQEVPPVSKNSAAYMKIENVSGVASALVSGDSDVARVIEFHEIVKTSDGLMKMQKLPQLAVPAHGNVTLAPGGYHVMLIDLQRKLKVGDEVKIHLVFEGGIERTIVAPVRKYSDMVK
jgi:copper(I)-binding protein